MKALLLAAGYATRLYPLTLDRPKSLLEIGSKPIIDFILNKIAEIKEIDKVFVVTNHKFYPNFKQWAEGVKNRLSIGVIDDGTLSNDDRLGAIGDIEFVIKRKKINDDLLVVGADNIFDAELSSFAGFSISKRPSNSVALYDLSDKKMASKYGVVSIDKDGRVVDFQEKPAHPKSTLISTCIYYFSSEKLRLFDEYFSQGATKDASGNYIKWLKDNDAVYGYVLSGRWYDIGDLESYKKADEEFR